MAKKVPVVENIMNANDQIAIQNRSKFNETKAFVINLMASPGAGKTSLIIEIVKGLKDKVDIGYIDGDLATSIDADKVASLGIPTVQINTGGQCHLDAVMIQNAIPQLTLSDLDLLILENVGNLVCPSAFQLGAHRNILIASVPEGDDKPYKYPSMYLGVDAIVLNKMDVLAAFDFDMQYFKKGVEILNPGLAFFPVSCKTSEGVDLWLEWLQEEVAKFKKSDNNTYKLR
jgi:hydrogenase nickel incorporation protein HypB